MGKPKSDGDDKSIVSRGAFAPTTCCGGISVEFILSAIGYAVGIGNVWRFPYKAANNGGGVFLVPYAIMLFCTGIPIFYLEIAFGQYSGMGPVTIWESIPLFKGLGWAMLYVSAIVCFYYNVVIAWSIYYLFASMSKRLPWTYCDESWNSDKVVCMYEEGYNSTLTEYTSESISPAEEYWYYRVLRLDQSTGIDDIGVPLWDLTLCNLMAWLIVFACLFKGVQSSGKVVYVTATFPYLVLVILFFFGIFREGAKDGIKFYLTPDWSKLADASIWEAAATQIFYSLGVAFGGLMTMASFNSFNNNVSRDTLIVCIGNCLTSFFAGFVIFSVIGNMAHVLNTEVEVLAGSGPGLAFIAYPAALALMPVPQLWSILFFLMMIMLGLDSQYAMVEVVVTGITDEFPHLREKKIYILGAVCTLGFLLGLPMTSPGGLFWFNLLDTYSAGLGFVIIALMLIIAIYWAYGNFATHRGRFLEDIKMMTGSVPNWYYKIMWWLITPVLLLFIIVRSSISYSLPTMHLGYVDVLYEYSATGDVISILLNFTPIVVLVFFGGLAVWKRGGFKGAIKPSEKWRPNGEPFGSHNYDAENVAYDDQEAI